MVSATHSHDAITFKGAWQLSVIVMTKLTDNSQVARSSVINGTNTGDQIQLLAAIFSGFSDRRVYLFSRNGGGNQQW